MKIFTRSKEKDQECPRNNWLSHLKNWKQSKKSKAAYCREVDISYHSFNYWEKQLNKRRQNEPSGFIEAKVTGQTAQETNPPQVQCDIELHNGHRLRLYNETTLTEIMPTLLNQA